MQRKYKCTKDFFTTVNGERKHFRKGTVWYTPSDVSFLLTDGIQLLNRKGTDLITVSETLLQMCFERKE